MLVLARKRDESIRIGTDIKINVLEVRGERVRLGFEAPREIGIHREEIYQARIAALEAENALLKEQLKPAA